MFARLSEGRIDVFLLTDSISFMLCIAVSQLTSFSPFYESFCCCDLNLQRLDYVGCGKANMQILIPMYIQLSKVLFLYFLKKSV